VVSDHGNLEDLTVGTHTLNPAIFAAWGPAAKGEAAAGSPRRLTDIASFTLRALGISGADPATSTA